MIPVLIVDDNKLERHGIRFLLEKQEYTLEITECSNGTEALKKIKEQNFELLITDIKMPIMNGVELITLLREFNQSLKIIVLSGYDDFNYARELLKSNIVDYLLKPINPNEFHTCITQVLNQIMDKKPITNDKIIDKVLSIMHHEFDRDLTLEDLSNRVFLSPNYLGILFKKEMNIGINKYLNNFRLEKACTLLLNSNMKVVDISRYIGFDNPSYFNRLFKNTYGLTPSTFREENMQ